MLLHELITRRNPSANSQCALIHGSRSQSYEELSESVRSTARGLAALGLDSGDRVGIYLNKRFETVASYFATSMAGGVFVPINNILKPPQVAHILNDCGATVLITSRAQASGMIDELANCHSLRAIVLVDALDPESTVSGIRTVGWAALLSSASITQRLHRRIDNDVASILYTSGSTGRPKGVVLSHRNMVNGAISVASYLENSAVDRILSVLPWSFDAGFSQLTTGFASGASVIMMDYLLPRDVLKAAAKHKATGLTGVPPLWNQLARLDWPEAAAKSLRYIANTGGAMPTATLATLREKLPNTHPFLMYGLTEAFRSTYLPPEELDQRPTSIGKAIPDAEILVVREDGTECSAGEPGELVHRGALVALGYWNDPERTAERFRTLPGKQSELPFPEIAVWSGDTVVKDEEGFLYFVGRKDDMIKSSGYRISPTEVEEVVYATGLVNECAALGIPHRELGQAVVIVAHAKTPTDEAREEILATCRKSLPNFMVPADVICKEGLPRNPNGKIDRKRLATELEDMFQDDDL